MTTSKTANLLELIGKKGLIRARDLKEHHIPYMYLHRLHQRGLVEKVSRGVYALAGNDYSSTVVFAEACLRIDDGVICLLSALKFHQIGTQNPHQVWMAIPNKKAVPRIDYPVLELVRFSGRFLEEGVVVHHTPEGPVRVYNIAKTVADCFRFRNKIGLDVALEALRECRRGRRATMEELWRYAEIDRVAKVMRPYLEAIG